MAEENETIMRLIEIGALERTDEPVNVLIPPRTDMTEAVPSTAANEAEAFYNRSAIDPFWATLGHAIQAYARLEQSLCQVFATSTGLTAASAASLFYKTVSSALRDEFLKTWTEERYGEKHSLFWRSLLKMLKIVTERRNQIVHWRAGIHYERNEIWLVLPRIHRLEDIKDNYINVEHLNEFIRKCAFMEEAIFRFLTIKDEFWPKHMKPHVLKTWQALCEREVVYIPASPRTP